MSHHPPPKCGASANGVPCIAVPGDHSSAPNCPDGPVWHVFADGRQWAAPETDATQEARTMDALTGGQDFAGYNFPVVATNHNDGSQATTWYPSRATQLAAAQGYLAGGFQVCAPDAIAMCPHVDAEA